MAISYYPYVEPASRQVVYLAPNIQTVLKMEVLGRRFDFKANFFCINFTVQITYILWKCLLTSANTTFLSLLK